MGCKDRTNSSWAPNKTKLMLSILGLVSDSSINGESGSLVGCQNVKVGT